MFRSASLVIDTSFTVAVFTIFATSNVDLIVGIPHKIYSMQRILIHIISRSLCWAHLHPGYAANLVARSWYYHCHWTLLEHDQANEQHWNWGVNNKPCGAHSTLEWFHTVLHLGYFDLYLHDLYYCEVSLSVEWLNNSWLFFTKLIEDIPRIVIVLIGLVYWWLNTKTTELQLNEVSNRVTFLLH